MDNATLSALLPRIMIVLVPSLVLLVVIVGHADDENRTFHGRVVAFLVPVAGVLLGVAYIVSLVLVWRT